MLFGQPIDSLIEIACRTWARFIGWSPIGKCVAIRVIEGEPGFFGTVVTGTIDRFERAISSDQNKASIGALIRLDAPWTLRSGSHAHTWVVAIPRFAGHTVWRLPLTSADVNVFPATDMGLEKHVTWENMIAICDLQLRSSREKGPRIESTDKGPGTH